MQNHPTHDAEIEAGAGHEMTTEAASASCERERSHVVLPDSLDSSAAASVKDMLLAERGNAIVVDASEVRRVGVQSLQVLVAAARTWTSEGHSYRLTNASTELLEAVALIGLPHEDLLLEGSDQ
ncbi:STAS domain-containing protein [Hyphomicrobium sp.]|jgi:anti-anti-sigma regulatory factor|uniref:STAS domain-containing protein n=1 Tax=Hyphomicrobium sp. TaxID=82 RepID=UPI002BDD74A2|nr:STAS domain-containing protein [Hyphomicrobium sp.]HVZ04408.1 STAS domain-containing protein [Hyphomicrobium sp.]